MEITFVLFIHRPLTLDFFTKPSRYLDDGSDVRAFLGNGQEHDQEQRREKIQPEIIEKELVMKHNDMLNNLL